MRHLAFPLLVSFLAVVVTLGIVETVLQLLDWPPTLRSGWYASYRRPGQINELGYRGRPVRYDSEDRVVVLLGDSQVEATPCVFEKVPEVALEASLHRRGVPARVVTVGAGGYGQDQQLLALRAYFERYRADLVVLWQTPLNDVWNNTWPTHWPGTRDGTPKPTFWLEGETLHGPTEALGERLSPWSKLVSLLHAPPAGRDARWEARLPPAYRPMERSAGNASEEWQEAWDADTASRAIRLENFASEKSHHAFSLVPSSPRLQYGLRLTRRLVAEIEAQAAAHDAPFVVLDVAAVHGTYPPRTETVYGLNGRYYRLSHAQAEANRRAMQAGFDVIEVRPAIEDWAVSPNDHHLNEAGVAEAMDLLAAALVERRVLE